MELPLVPAVCLHDRDYFRPQMHFKLELARQVQLQVDADNILMGPFTGSRRKQMHSSALLGSFQDHLTRELCVYGFELEPMQCMLWPSRLQLSELSHS